ncbi:hypothetical protein ACOJQI_22845 (plasmid) [Bacillus salacetis]|uniref:hypothetical protein n=1 Tax=Bacillus salacetis TaxID=2315464 RepID=UPI003BA281D1
MKKEFEYSDEEVLKKAATDIRNGSTYEEIQKKFNLTDDDLELIEFVVEEF